MQSFVQYHYCHVAQFRRKAYQQKANYSNNVQKGSKAMPDVNIYNATRSCYQSSALCPAGAPFGHEWNKKETNGVVQWVLPRIIQRNHYLSPTPHLLDGLNCIDRKKITLTSREDPTWPTIGLFLLIALAQSVIRQRNRYVGIWEVSYTGERDWQCSDALQNFNIITVVADYYGYLCA